METCPNRFFEGERNKVEGRVVLYLSYSLALLPNRTIEMGLRPSEIRTAKEKLFS